MQIVLDFKSEQQERPNNLENCLVIILEENDMIHNAIYYEFSDEFFVSELCVYKSSQVLWAKASV